MKGAESIPVHKWRADSLVGANVLWIRVPWTTVSLWLQSSTGTTHVPPLHSSALHQTIEVTKRVDARDSSLLLRLARYVASLKVCLINRLPLEISPECGNFLEFSKDTFAKILRKSSARFLNLGKNGKFFIKYLKNYQNIRFYILYSKFEKQFRHCLWISHEWNE